MEESHLYSAHTCKPFLLRKTSIIELDAQLSHMSLESRPSLFWGEVAGNRMGAPSQLIVGLLCSNVTIEVFLAVKVHLQ
jgi:hypothetical protein